MPRWVHLVATPVGPTVDGTWVWTVDAEDSSTREIIRVGHVTCAPADVTRRARELARSERPDFDHASVVVEPTNVKEP
jgi:hypothetical protein